MRLRRRGRVVADPAPAGESQPGREPPGVAVTLLPGPGVADVVVEEREKAVR